jgi:hypothetical protein
MIYPGILWNHSSNQILLLCSIHLSHYEYSLFEISQIVFSCQKLLKSFLLLYSKISSTVFLREFFILLHCCNRKQKLFRNLKSMRLMNMMLMKRRSSSKMTWKTKRERMQYYSIKLQSQIINLLKSFQELSEHADYANVTTSELYDNFRPPKTPTYNQMKNIGFYEKFLC